MGVVVANQRQGNNPWCEEQVYSSASISIAPTAPQSPREPQRASVDGLRPNSSISAAHQQSFLLFDII